MGKRIDLHKELCAILGSNNVYYQPPETMKIKYPAIVYSKSALGTIYADNSPYQHNTPYQVTFITREADSEVTTKLADMKMSRQNSRFTADNLYHDVFTIYY